MSGVISAVSKDAAYAELKSKGIRPSRVTESAGVFNKLFGKGKRWIAISVLAVLSLSLALVARSFRNEVLVAEDEKRSPLPRHQIYGDPALMDMYERNDYADLFEYPGDRYLARFVQPGVEVRVPGVGDVATRRALCAALSESVRVPDSKAIVLLESDSREAGEIKRTVIWMREELRRYLENGRGSVERYLLRLEERQRKEVQIYNRISQELKTSNDSAFWERQNEALRALGIRTISRSGQD